MRQVLSARPLRVEFACKFIKIERHPVRLMRQRRSLDEARIKRDGAHQRKFPGVVQSRKFRPGKPCRPRFRLGGKFANVRARIPENRLAARVTVLDIEDGVIARLLVVEPDAALWDEFFGRPVDAGERQRLSALEPYLNPVPLPGVAAAIAEHAKVAGVSREVLESRIAEKTMLRRMPKMAEIADAAVFAASDRASALTAAVLNATCGEIAD